MSSLLWDNMYEIIPEALFAIFLLYMWLSKHMSSACFLRLELHLQKKLKNVLVINRID